MSSRSTTTTLFACDRCGAEETSTGSSSFGKMPNGWKTLGFGEQFYRDTYIDRYPHKEPPAKPAEVCPACVDSYVTWLNLNGGRKPAGGLR